MIGGFGYTGRMPFRPVTENVSPPAVRVTCVAAVLAVVVAAYLMVPRRHDDRESAHRVICASHLRQLGLGVILHAQADPEGRFPANLAAARWQGVELDAFVCPLAEHANYLWLGGGLTYEDVAERGGVALAVEPAANHQDYGGNVLWGDGAVTFENVEDLVPLMERAVAEDRLSRTEADHVVGRRDGMERRPEP